MEAHGPEELREIPGVGKKISRDLWNLGVRSVGDLEGRDPEELYLFLPPKTPSFRWRIQAGLSVLLVWYSITTGKAP
ncbi:MAG: helix-hairpin-helix domain-containing protein [Actinomycetia bacterium]|nr:helix-hairpin-helix domain-containing protein [Actinomycetes bacterium]